MAGNNFTLHRTEESRAGAMLHAAGVQSGFLAGFIASFAEYFSTVEGGAIPDLYRWKPDAAMTDEEIADDHASYEEMVAED